MSVLCGLGGRMESREVLDISMRAGEMGGFSDGTGRSKCLLLLRGREGI